jgi:hypothetical protein
MSGRARALASLGPAAARQSLWIATHSGKQGLCVTRMRSEVFVAEEQTEPYVLRSIKCLETNHSAGRRLLEALAGRNQGAEERRWLDTERPSFQLQPSHLPRRRMTEDGAALVSSLASLRTRQPVSRRGRVPGALA